MSWIKPPHQYSRYMKTCKELYQLHACRKASDAAGWPGFSKAIASLHSTSKQSHVFVTRSLSSPQPVSLFVHSTEAKPTCRFNSGHKCVCLHGLVMLHFIMFGSAGNRWSWVLSSHFTSAKFGIYGRNSICALAQAHNWAFIVFALLFATHFISHGSLGLISPTTPRATRKYCCCNG